MYTLKMISNYIPRNEYIDRIRPFIDKNIINKISHYITNKVNINSIEVMIYTIINEEYKYLELLEKCLLTGHLRQTRNSETLSLFTETLTFDLKKGFLASFLIVSTLR